MPDYWFYAKFETIGEAIKFDPHFGRHVPPDKHEYDRKESFDNDEAAEKYFEKQIEQWRFKLKLQFKVDYNCTDRWIKKMVTKDLGKPGPGKIA